MRNLKAILKIFILSLSSIILLFSEVDAQEDTTLFKKVINRSKISGQWFLAYTNDISDNMNEFNLKRGYFTVKTDITNHISVRYTQDITIDKEGSDAGNVEMRLKYLYMKLRPFTEGIFKHTFLELGMVHRPWLDFEQKINQYRVQGKMYLEDIGIFNSADFGINICGYLGGKLDESAQSKIGSHYPGKYGSFSFGIFNGPGYNDAELNNNKTFESRISLRPFPEIIPGLQFSYSNALGKANTESGNVDFKMHLAFISFEHRYFTCTGQYYTGAGDSYGTYIFNDIAQKNTGLSFFGEFRIPKTSFSVLGRYDEFRSSDEMNVNSNGFFTGVSYRFLKNKLLMYYSRDFFPYGHQDIAEIVLEIAF